MAETMVRKQVYLEREQDRKLKALAAQRRCTEAELIREALDRLPDPEVDDVLVRLDAAGLLAPESDRRSGGREVSDPPDADSVADLESNYDAWLASRAEPLGLVDALRRDRAGR